MMDLATILKAVEVVGSTTPAALQLYDAFIALTGGADQATLQQRYQAAKDQSDRLHADVQREFKA